jgi:hypothetical protein
MAATQAMLDAAFNEGYCAHDTKAPCPYFSTGTGEWVAELKEAWDRGFEAAFTDDLNSYMAGLSRQNAQEEDAVDILRRLDSKLDQILAKLG